MAEKPKTLKLHSNGPPFPVPQAASQIEFKKQL